MREIISTALDWSCKIIVWSTTKFIPQHLLYFRARCCSWYDGLSDRSFMVDRLSYFSKTTTNKQTNKNNPKKTPKTTTYKSNLVKQCSKFHCTRVYRVLRCLKLGQKGFSNGLCMRFPCFDHVTDNNINSIFLSLVYTCPDGHDGAVVMSSANGLVGSAFAFLYRLQPTPVI